jgi:hypothetical protein
MPASPSVLEEVIRPAVGGMSPALARYVLSLDFPAKTQARCAKLSKKANRGTLTDKERAELEEFVSVNDFLMLIQAKARTSLRRRTPAA